MVDKWVHHCRIFPHWYIIDVWCGNKSAKILVIVVAGARRMDIEGSAIMQGNLPFCLQFLILDRIMTCVPLEFALPITLRLVQSNHRGIIDKDSPLEMLLEKQLEDLAGQHSPSRGYESEISIKIDLLITIVVSHTDGKSRSDVVCDVCYFESGANIVYVPALD